MLKWECAKIFEFCSSDLERHVFVFADSLVEAAELCGLSVDENVGYHCSEVIIPEQALDERNCPNDESDES